MLLSMARALFETPPSESQLAQSKAEDSVYGRSLPFAPMISKMGKSNSGALLWTQG